jgi:hypothetical protein
LASIHFPREQVVELCNAAWNPSNPQETGIKYDDLPSRCNTPITKGTMIHFLQLHGTNVDFHSIFPPKRKNRVDVYYNEYRALLLDHPVVQAEIDAYFSDMLTFIYGQGVFAHKYYVDEKDKYGNTYRRVVTKLSKKPPFMGLGAFNIQVVPTTEEMVQGLTKLAIHKDNAVQAPRLMSLIAKLTDQTTTLHDALVEYKTIMDADWEYKIQRTDKAITSMMQQRSLTEYAEINFRPYAGTKCPLPNNVMNTFDGFVLERYIPNKKIDISQTLIYEYLCRVFGHSETMNERLAELLDRVAFKLQFPQIRTGRIHTISALEQGIGKSAFFRFLSMIFSSKYCVFHDNLDTYLSRFNWHMHSKLVHFIDDLQGCTKTQTRKLYSKVTSDHILTEKKGEDIIKMDEFSELWITGNQNSCSLHVCAEDRRILIYKANPCLKNNKKFWNDLHSEFSNLDIAKAWYDHLKARPVDNFNYHTNSTASDTAKLDSITDCMPKSHLFLNNVFTTEDFLVTYKRQIQVLQKKNKPPKIRVDKATFYQAYKFFVGNNYSSSSVRHINTFLKELSTVGVVNPDKRQKLNGKNRFVLEFEFDAIQRVFQSRYKGMSVNEWVLLTNLADTLKFLNA